MDNAATAAHVQRWAHDNVALSERSQMAEMTEGSLLSLQEVNFAKFRLPPSEFEAWHAVWTQ